MKLYIKSDHPAAYHSGEWAEVLDLLYLPDTRHWCFAVVWPSGDMDWWPVVDPSAGYQFKEA